MKRILFSLLILTSLSYGQTKQETQDWIKEKINYYSYSDDHTVFNDYTVSYEDENMILKNNLKSKIGGITQTMVLTYIIPIKDLNKIRFENKGENVWLYLKTKSGNTIRTKADFESDYNLTNSVEILLESSFSQNDMQNRMNKAFINLIKLYGGQITTEKF